MTYKLVFSVDLEKKLKDTMDDTKAIWTSVGIHDYKDLMERIIQQTFVCYPKVDITHYEFRDTVEVCGQSSTYFGVIEDEEENVVAYAFMIPPRYRTRSGVLAQQVFPVLSGITPKLAQSKDNKITNKPIFILNANEENLTGAMAVNIVSGLLLDFRYVDVYERNLEEILMSNGLAPKVHSLKDYDTMIESINKSKVNELFEVDEVNKSLRFLTLRLKDGIHVNNEPYWFVLKAYAAFYLGQKEGYTCDMSVIDTLERGNKTLDAFRDYISKVTA